MAVGVIGAVLLTGGLMVASAPQVFAAPNDSQQECKAAGGTFKNTASSGSAPNYTCQITWTKDRSPVDRATSYSYYKLLRICVQNHMRNTIQTEPGQDGATSPGQAGGGGSDGTDKGEWFDDNQAYGYVYPDGKLDCDEVAAKAIALWGWSGEEFLRAIGYTYDDSAPQWKSPNNDGAVRAQKYQQAVTARVGTGLVDDAVWYVLYEAMFTGSDLGQCQARNEGVFSSVDSTLKKWATDGTIKDGKTYVKVRLADGAKTKEYVFSYVKDNPDYGHGVINHGAPYRYHGEDTPVFKTSPDAESCAQIAKKLSEKAPALAEWNERAAEGEQVVSDVTDPGSGGGATEEDAPSCGSLISGIGWIVCPALDGIALMNDNLWNILAALLTADPLEQNGAFYELWKAFRNIANVLLVVAFLVIIYSQMTSMGVTNYGIKKTLPRLIIVAIAINVSYFIVAAMVDVFNVLGSSLYDLLEAVGNQAKGEVTWENLIGLIVGLGAGAVTIGVGIAVAGGAGALLLFLLPMAAMALIGVIVALLTLMLRQALIPLLAILAPLAFVAYLLPNTQGLFTRWRKMFVGMLLLFPIAALLFGGLQIAGTTIAAGGDGVLSVLIGLVVMGAPLFMLPFIASKAGPMLGNINSKMKGFAGKAREPINKWSGSHRKLAAAKYDAKGIGKSGRSLRGIRSRFQKANKIRDIRTAGFNADREGEFNQYLADNAESIAADQGTAGKALVGATAERAIAESIKNAELSARIPPGDFDAMKAKFLEAVKEGDSVMARAMQNKMLHSGGPGINAFRQVMTSGDVNESTMDSKVKEGLRSNILENHAGLKKTAADVDGWASDSGGRDMAKVRDDKKTWAMSDVEFAAQHKTSQAAALAAGGVGADQAERIITDPRLVAQLDPTIRSQLEGITAPTSAAATTPSAPATLNVGHGTSGNSAPSAEERAHFSGDDRRD